MAEENGQAYSAAGGPKAVLCLHGLTGTPYEIMPIARALAAAGHAVCAPRLVGHGTCPESLAQTRWSDWLASARIAFDSLASKHEQVFILGNSMGALVALVLAHERGARVAGVVAMATPLELQWKAQTLLTVARRVPLADALPYIAKRGGPDVSDPAVAAAMPSYDRIPIAAAQSLIEGQQAAEARAPRLSVPVLVQHGRHDHTAPVHNARRLHALLRTPHRRLAIYPRSWHILALDVEHEQVVADVLDFVSNPAGSTGPRK